MTLPHITLVTKENFEKEVMQSDKLVLIDFYADWCGPCQALAPVLEELAQENPNVKVVKIDVEKSGDIADAFKVQGIPTLFTVKDGKAICAISGYRPRKDLDALIEETLKLITPPSSPPPSPPAPPTGPAI